MAGRREARERSEKLWTSLRGAVADLPMPVETVTFLCAVRDWYFDNGADLKAKVIEIEGESDSVYTPLSLSWLCALDYATLPLEANGMTARDYHGAIVSRIAPRNETEILRFVHEMLRELTIARSNAYFDRFHEDVVLFSHFDSGKLVLYRESTGDTYHANGLPWRGDVSRLVPLDREALAETLSTLSCDDATRST